MLTLEIAGKIADAMYSVIGEPTKAGWIQK